MDNSDDLKPVFESDDEMQRQPPPKSRRAKDYWKTTTIHSNHLELISYYYQMIMLHIMLSDCIFHDCEILSVL